LSIIQMLVEQYLLLNPLADIVPLLMINWYLGRARNKNVV